MEFTHEEKTKIFTIVEQYRAKGSEVRRLEETIRSAESELFGLISEVKELQESEKNYLESLSNKYDVEIGTIEKAAANFVIENQ
jgi:uncharacterized coiled-coil DUF342 family protein